MVKVIKIWPYLAIDEALKALDEFHKTGDRNKFKKWSKKYKGQIDEEKEALTNRLKGKSTNKRPAKNIIKTSGFRRRM